MRRALEDFLSRNLERGRPVLSDTDGWGSRYATAAGVLTASEY
jgi:hypothetical protein